MKLKVVKIVSIILCILTLAGILSVVFVTKNVKSSPCYAKFDESKLSNTHSNLTILDNDGNKLKEALYFNNIKQIPLEALHDYTYMAFVAVEDKRFFSHKGIDARRVAGAILSNLRSKSLKEGASTISQQLIKNTHLDNAKTLQRKINEMDLALQLEKRYTKEQILEIYLNTIYFGRNAYGIENAANVYFDKSASDLTVSESAILAGIIKAPNTYAPDKNIQKCATRRNVVLKLMKDQNIIDQQQYQDALTQQIVYTPQKKKAEKTYAYYALKEACKLLNMTECQLLNSNLTIETYCDQFCQQQTYQLAMTDQTLDTDGNLTNLCAILTDNCGHVQACYTRGENADGKRQAGSTLKPIAVYTPAFNEKIITQASLILDEQTNFNGYIPQNVNGYHGWTTVKDCVAQSLNVPAVKTLNALTIPTAQKYLQKLGFCGEQNLSLALGNINGGITPFELAKCYATLANCGKANEVKFVKRIVGSNGEIFRDCTQNYTVFDKASTFLMTDLLVNTVNSGTAKRLSNAKYQVAGKTGTVGNANGNSDAIIAGYTTQNTFVVWYSGKLSNKISGSRQPCAFASNLLNNIYKGKFVADFLPPNNVVNLTLDKDSLHQKQQTLLADKGDNFWFDKRNAPHEKLELKKYNQTLNCKYQDDFVLITLPATEGVWELWKQTGTQQSKVSLQSNLVQQLPYTDDTSYFAKLYVEGKFVYQTPLATVVKPQEEMPKENKETNKTQRDDQQNGSWNWLDFWYWK